MSCASGMGEMTIECMQWRHLDVPYTVLEPDSGPPAEGPGCNVGHWTLDEVMTSNEWGLTPDYEGVVTSGSGEVISDQMVVISSEEILINDDKGMVTDNGWEPSN